MVQPNIDATLGVPTTNGFVGSTSTTFTPGNVQTAGTNEVVCLAIASNSVSGFPISVSGASLTWTLAYRTQTASGIIDLWTAQAASVVNFNSQTLTITFSASVSRIDMRLFAVQNCASISTPFDTRFDLPAQGVSTTTAPTLTYSTTQSDDLLVFLSAQIGSTGAGGTPSGWTGTATAAPSNPPQCHIYTKQVSAAQSSQTVQDTSANSTNWIGMVVSFTADSVTQPTNAPRPDPLIPFVSNAVFATSSPVAITPGNMQSSASSLICLAISYSSTSNSVTSVTTTGLTWTKRSRITGTGITVELWTAPASSSFNFNTLTIDVNISTTFIRIGTCLFGVIGLNSISTPFDANGGLPDSASNSTSVAPPSVTYSTNKADDILFFFSANPSTATPATPSGWWNMCNVNSSNFDFAMSFLRVNATQSSSTVADASATSGTWIGVLDAMTADPATTTHNESVTESLTAADTISENVQWLRSLTETLTAADMVGVNGEIPESLSESLTAADTVAENVQWLRSITETLSAADAIGQSVTTNNCPVVVVIMH